MLLSRTFITASAVATATALCAGPALSAPSAGQPAPSPATAATEFTNVDDYSGNAQYTKYYNQELDWSNESCGDFLYSSPGATYECAFVTAPKDWHNPDTGDIKVAISRIVEHTDMTPGARRLLLSNPGGPGADGMFFGTYYMHINLNQQTTHNAIGVSPRGTGLSTLLACTPPKVSPDNFRHDEDSRTFTPEGVKAANRDQAEYFAQCDKESNGLQKFINSDQTARDYNLIRAVLGYEQSDFWGVSYGAWLGANMAKMFPNNFDRVVLDGNPNWQTDSLEVTFLRMPEAVQAVVDQHLFPWVAEHSDRYGLGGRPRTVAANFERIREAAAAGKLGTWNTPDQVDLRLVAAARSPFFWDSTMQYFVRLFEATKNPAAAAKLRAEQSASTPVATVDSTAPRNFSMELYRAVSCSDTPGITDYNEWAQKVYPTVDRYPTAGPTFRSTRCAGWQHAPALTEEIINRPLKQVLMLDQEADPATSYLGAYRASQAVKGNVAHLVVDDQIGHGAPSRTNQCAKDHFFGYLLEGKFPEGDVHCQAGPVQVRDASDGTMMPNDTVYEYGNPASDEQPLPATSRYFHRIFMGLPVDRKATQEHRENAGKRSETLPAMNDQRVLDYLKRSHEWQARAELNSWGK